jgi:hypothetical protein
MQEKRQMAIELKRVDRGHKDEHWMMDLGEKVVLIGPDGNAVLEFDPPEAISRFRMPNSWKNINYFGVQTKDGLVKPGEAGRVLLRWQLAPNEYRVIFGDLHTETVTPSRLAQLEAMLPR